MAEKRMISKAISISEKVNIGLTDVFHMLLYTWIIPHSDDFGRLPGSPAKVKALVVPMLDKSIKDVERGLQEMNDCGLIHWYEIEGHRYIQIINFEEHQQGLHKRTKSKIPEFPGNSRKFSEIPLEGKGREEKGTGSEEEGKGIPSPDSNPHKDRIHSLINECNIEEYTLYHLDEFFSFIGAVDIEVIEAAIKKGQGRHVNYALKTLKGMAKDGITKKEQIHSKPKVGEPSEKHERVDQHGRADAEDKPITGGAVGWLPSSFNKVVPLRDVSG